MVKIPINLPSQILRPQVKARHTLADIQIFRAGQSFGTKQIHQANVNQADFFGLQCHQFGERGWLFKTA
jgi:hypothetical protein